MRPLIEILEDERTLAQKQDAVYRYLTKTNDLEVINILNGQRKRVEQDLNKNRDEIRAYIEELFKGDDRHE